jgi:mannose-1-phosphate guanylyltransferase
MKAHAMVLCAGLGTRLRPLTLELPKPLVPVGDRPLLAHITERLRAAGLGHVVLNTHHLAEAFRNIGASLGIEAQVVHEPVIRGTAGGVAGARRWLEAPLVLWNGDILADPPLVALLEAARTGGLALAYAPRPLGEGTLGVDEAGRVVRLRGQRFGIETTGGDYVGVAGLGKRCLDTLPETGCLVGDWALPELRAGRAIHAVPCLGAWSDAGDLGSYLELNQRWLGGRAAYVAPDAGLDAEVSLREAVVGAGARVTGRGELRRVVVWPRAHAVAPLSDAVVTTKGLVVTR